MKNIMILKFWLIMILGGMIPQFILASSNTVSTSVLMDSRDYVLMVSSAQGTPVPAVGANGFPWQSTITASVEIATGFTLIGWTGTGAIPAAGTTNSTGPISLTNLLSSINWNWVANSYTATFDAQDGEMPVTALKVVVFGSIYGELPTTTRAWHSFAGWWSAPSGGVQVTSKTIVCTAVNHTLYAHWVPTTCAIMGVVSVAESVRPSLMNNPKYGLSLDGAGDYIQSPPMSSMTLPITIEMWVKSASSSPVGIFDSAPDKMNVLRNYGAGKTEWWNADPSVTLDLPTNTWTHIAFVFSYDGHRHIDYYRNGQLASSATGSTSSAIAWDSLTIGGINGGASGFYQGQVDEVRVWKSARTAEQIAANIYRSLQCNEPGLALCWSFDDATGRDLTTNHYDAVLYGDACLAPRWDQGAIRIAAMNTPDDFAMCDSGLMQYSTVVTGGWFELQGVPVLSDYWVKAFIDVNCDGVWSPVEPIGSFLGNPVYLTNTFTGANITMNYGDWDSDGIPDDEEAFVLMTSASNSLSPIQVDDDGPNDPGPGDPNVSDPLADGTRDHPYDSIQKGINAAINGMTVLVMDGYYTSTGNRDITLNGKAITVRSRHGADRVQVEDFTRGFICNSNETTNTVIQGFSIHTWATYFGLEGIRIDGSSPTIRDCNIWDCGVAGILCTNGAQPVIERCVVNGNTGGVRIFGSSPTIDRCTIVSNATDLGAGIYISGSSKPTIQNCLIADNVVTVEGGGMYIGTGSSPTNINCTIAGNSAVTRGGGVSSDGSPVFYNDIIYNNTAPASTGIYASAAMTVQYSCLQSFYPGLGNKTNNPNLNIGDGYKLTAGSVAIDAGTVAFMPSVDLLGVPRPVDGDTNGTATVDMGCYEYIPASLDSDADGVPDWWTWQYFGHLSGQGSDYSLATNTFPGSQMTIYEKYLADLDPTNPLSVLAVTGIQWLPQGIKVDWEGGQWAKQYLESKSDLCNTNEPWTPVFTNLPPTAIMTNVTVNAGTTNTAGFFRIRAER